MYISDEKEHNEKDEKRKQRILVYGKSEGKIDVATCDMGVSFDVINGIELNLNVSERHISKDRTWRALQMNE